VRVNEPGKKRLASQIRALGVCRYGSRNFGKISNRNDFRALNCHCRGIRVLWVACKNLCIEKDSSWLIIGCK